MKRIQLANLNKDPFDVVVIGAGINGSGAVQQLAARGYRVLIIDKDDFASGATHRSSRILHCGLRHLAPGKSVWDCDQGQAKLEPVAKIMAEVLGWNDAQTQEPLSSYMRYVEKTLPSHH